MANRAKKKSKKSKKSKIIRVAFVAFFVYVVASFTLMQVDIAHRRDLLAQANQELSQQGYLKEEITGLLNSGESVDYILKIAREKLNLAFPNERVIIDYKRK